MAALYLHNALFSEDQPGPHQMPNSHLHNAHSASTVTLQPTTSQPTEPLLPANTTGSPGFPQRQLSPHGGAEMRLSPHRRHSPSNTEWDGDWENTFRRRLKVLRRWRQTSLGIICAWTLYNSIRYFLSFPNFISRERQLFALILGASTTLSLALIIASLSINLLLPAADLPKTPGTINVVKRIILPLFASWFLLAPSIVNFVLVFGWKHSSDPQMTLLGRCSWDIDVVWSGIGMVCTTPESSPLWRSWLIGATFRLAFTLGVLAAYHIICYKYEVSRRLTEQRSYTRFPTQQRYHHDSTFANAHIGAAADQNYIPVSTTISPPPTAHRHLHHRSQSAPDDVENGSHSTYTAYRSEPSYRSPPKTPKIMPSDGYTDSPIIIPADLSTSFAGQCASSEDNVSSETSTGDGSVLSSRFAPASNESDLHNFVNRFQAVVDQVSKETRDGLDIVRPESRVDHRPPRYTNSNLYDDGEEEFDPYSQVHQPSSLPHVQGDEWYYNEFGQPTLLQQPDDDDDGGRVEVFGRLIHRMPTIESLGSREHGSLATPSMSTHHMEREISSRTNTLSDHDSPISPVSWGRSRSDSWDTASRGPSRQAFRAAGEALFPNEMGELVTRPVSHATLDFGATGKSGGETSIVTGSSRSTTNNTFYSAADSVASAEIK